MKKILLFTIVVVFSCAAFGQTTVVGACSVPTQACIKARVSLSGQTASVTTTTLYTPTAAGTYRISATGWVTTAGSAGTFSVTAITNSGAGGSNTSANLVSALSMTSLLMNGGVITYHVGAGQNIQFATTVSGATGSPVYGVEVVVEQLQ